MALNTLKGTTVIDGYEVFHRTHEADRSLMADDYVIVDHKANTVTFKIQDGPVGEQGKNGCQVDTVIAAARHMIHGLNQEVPCRENSCAITKLDEALHWLHARFADRIARDVEGTDKK